MKACKHDHRSRKLCESTKTELERLLCACVLEIPQTIEVHVWFGLVAKEHIWFGGSFNVYRSTLFFFLKFTSVLLVVFVFAVRMATWSQCETEIWIALKGGVYDLTKFYETWRCEFGLVWLSCFAFLMCCLRECFFSLMKRPFQEYIYLSQASWANPSLFGFSCCFESFLHVLHVFHSTLRFPSRCFSLYSCHSERKAFCKEWCLACNNPNYPNSRERERKWTRPKTCWKYWK